MTSPVPAAGPPLCVLLALDRDSRPAVLDFAANEAQQRGCALRIVHVSPSTARTSKPAPASPLVIAAVEATRSRVPTSGETVSGDAGRALVALSATASLLVLASSRPREGGMLLGEVSQHCVRHSACPVVVIPRDWNEPLPVFELTASDTPTLRQSPPTPVNERGTDPRLGRSRLEPSS
jgi:nucleotide-binding universal stress UspA family protein